MTRALLLGAGASADAGLPTTREMTRRAIAELQGASRSSGEVLRALYYVCGAIIGFDSARGVDPYEDVDIERLVSAVDLLATREQHEIAPFVSWDPALERLGRHGRSAFFDQDFNRALLGQGSVEHVITNLVEEIAGTSDSRRALEELRTQLTKALVSILSIGDSSVLEYLHPILDLAARQGSLAVATLNYDTAIEMACRDAEVECCLGITEWSGGGEPLHWTEDGLNLIKLHGSIDWTWQPAAVAPPPVGQQSRQIFRQRRLQVGGIPEANNPYQEPALVFGQRGKLRAEGPFLELLLAFGRLLNQADELICVGYSFRDEHVNEYLRRWLGRDEMRKVTVIDYPAWPQLFGGSQGDFRWNLQWAARAPTSGDVASTSRVTIVHERARDCLARILSG
jgi:hypothetical protein